MKRFIVRRFADFSTRKMVLLLLIGAMIVIALVVLVYCIGRSLEMNAIGHEEVHGDLTGRFEEPRIVVFNDASYQYRDGLLTVLLMGIDKSEEGINTARGFRNGGQADFLLLLVFDTKAKTITPVHIDRDTMAEITVLGVLGNEAGTRKAQICLSHGFGDGGEQSCKLTVDAVSKLLNGIDIDFYISIDMDAISIINDSLGGVTVILKDDFTSLDSQMIMGSTIKLMGNQAEYYVRSRMSIGIGTNEARMERQREYLSSAGEQLKRKLSVDKSFIGNLFDDLGNNLQTNMTRGRMINEFYGGKDHYKKEIVTLEGNYIVGKDGFMEFLADESSTTALVIDLFFTPVV